MVILFASCSELSKSVTSPVKLLPTYEQDIQSIFKQSCVKCHGGNTTQANYDLSSYETAVDSIENIIPGDTGSKILLRTKKNSNMYLYLNSPEESELIYNWVVSNDAAKE